ncbi:amidohydrolase family protein [Acidisarcina polymorpha]|nr:amidohydrolase family protein [Acidisarcina polymorpha]
MSEYKPMRLVTLEEHFTISECVHEIDPGTAKERGYWSRDQPYGVLSFLEELLEVGDKRIATMDQFGITVQVLSWDGPGADLIHGEAGVTWAKQVNDRLASIVATHPDRYAGLAHLPLNSPEASADELERCIRQLGFKGAMVRGATEGRFLDDPIYAPLLARAEALEVPLYLHPGIPPKAARDAYFSHLPEPLGFFLSIAGWGWHSDTAIHVLRMALSGSLDRHPKLQLVIGHLGEGLAEMLTRFDQILTRRLAEGTARTVREMLLQQVHVTISGFAYPAMFETVLKTFGPDRILASLDYPFVPLEGATRFIRTLPVTSSDLEKIMHSNADRLFKLVP